MDKRAFQRLTAYLGRIPAVSMLGTGTYSTGLWWVKLQIDIEHQAAWRVVQELGCVLNYLSVSERLPTVFYPVSPAPYLNGGPAEFLAWIIESQQVDFTPDILLEWLDGRLPQPVDDLTQWVAPE